MKVAVPLEHHWNRVPGGTARSAARLFEELLGRPDLETVGFHGWHRKPPVLELPALTKKVTLPIPGRLSQQIWARASLPTIDRFVKADLVHGVGYLLPPTKRPKVVTIHDLAFLHHPEWFTENGVTFLTHFLERAIELDATVTTPSEQTADDCLHAGFRADKVYVVPWGARPVAVTAGDVESLRSQLALPERFVLYVGTNEPRKNLAGLIAAMNSVDAALVVAGPSGWKEADVGTAMKMPDLTDRQLRILMTAADVLVYPSFFEGFGLPVVEAMAQGTPVVVAEGTTPAALAADAGVEVDPRDPGSIAEGIRSLLDDEAHAAKLSKVALRRAQEFSWDRTASQMINVYRDALV